MPHFLPPCLWHLYGSDRHLWWIPGVLSQGLRRAKVVPQVGLKNAITVSLEEYSDVIVSRFVRSVIGFHGWIDGSFNKPWMERLKKIKTGKFSQFDPENTQF
jgi:hypothetical protein